MCRLLNTNLCMNDDNKQILLWNILCHKNYLWNYYEKMLTRKILQFYLCLNGKRHAKSEASTELFMYSSASHCKSVIELDFENWQRQKVLLFPSVGWFFGNRRHRSMCLIFYKDLKVKILSFVCCQRIFRKILFWRKISKVWNFLLSDFTNLFEVVWNAKFPEIIFCLQKWEKSSTSCESWVGYISFNQSINEKCD